MVIACPDCQERLYDVGDRHLGCRRCSRRWYLGLPLQEFDTEPSTPPADAPPTREQQPDDDEEDVI